MVIVGDDEAAPLRARLVRRLSRLRRQRDLIIAQHGEDLYQHVDANLHWEVFQFLGKLLPVVYVLRRPWLRGTASPAHL